MHACLCHICLYLIYYVIWWKNNYSYFAWFALILSILLLVYSLYFIKIIILKGQPSPTMEVISTSTGVKYLNPPNISAVQVLPQGHWHVQSECLRFVQWSSDKSLKSSLLPMLCSASFGLLPLHLLVSLCPQPQAVLIFLV